MKKTDQLTAAMPDIVSGPIERAQRIGIYGPEGVGKTTLASQFPSPVFIDLEDGSHHLSATRFARPNSWSEVEQMLRYLAEGEHDYQTVVIDTIDWLEKLLAAHICQRHHKQSVGDFGYGKGYVLVAEAFTTFLEKLDQLRQRGLHVVVVAHSQIRKFEQPEAAGAYDRYELKLSKHCSPLLKEWCDLLLFVNYFTKVTETDGKKRALGGKERRIYTTHSAAFDAKNRHGLDDVLPMNFASIASVIPAVEVDVASGSTGSITDAQIQKIESLWRELGFGRDEMTRLFTWLGLDAVPGDEQWRALSPEHAAKAIDFLSKKLSGKEGAQ